MLVSDDDTAFHGEFSDDWTVNGKVERMSPSSVWSGFMSITVSQKLCVLSLITFTTCFKATWRLATLFFIPQYLNPYRCRTWQLLVKLLQSSSHYVSHLVLRVSCLWLTATVWRDCSVESGAQAWRWWELTPNQLLMNLTTKRGSACCEF